MKSASQSRCCSLVYKPPALGPGEIHVWRIPLDQSPEIQDRVGHFLSDDERARARRFYFERDRDWFAAGRGILRAILGEYLQTDPAMLRFSYGERGKPAIAAPESGKSMGFNLSHSAGMALLAIARARRIGVDVECLRPVPDAEQIASQFFSPYERAVLAALPPEHRAQAFFNCWTRKEAFIKATGDGLAQPLDHFDVTLAPAEPAALLALRETSESAAHWFLRELYPAAGYAAAVAADAAEMQIECFDWQCL